jgi:hypothetical protein
MAKVSYMPCVEQFDKALRSLFYESLGGFGKWPSCAKSKPKLIIYFPPIQRCIVISRAWTKKLEFCLHTLTGEYINDSKYESSQPKTGKACFTQAFPVVKI